MTRFEELHAANTLKQESVRLLREKREKAIQEWNMTVRDPIDKQIAACYREKEALAIEYLALLSPLYKQGQLVTRTLAYSGEKNPMHVIKSISVDLDDMTPEARYECQPITRQGKEAHKRGSRHYPEGSLTPIPDTDPTSRKYYRETMKRRLAGQPL